MVKNVTDSDNPREFITLIFRDRKGKLDSLEILGVISDQSIQLRKEDGIYFFLKTAIDCHAGEICRRFMYLTDPLPETSLSILSRFFFSFNF